MIHLAPLGARFDHVILRPTGFFDKETKRLIREALESRLRELNPIASCDAVLAAKGNEEQWEAIGRGDNDFRKLYKLYRSFGGKLRLDELSAPIDWPKGVPYVETDDEGD
ncbi:MAG: hypothetical protein WB586_28605 [Chthoniobacterales bacterium]